MQKKRIIIFSTAYLPLIGGSEMAIKEITGRLEDFNFDLITAKLRKGLPSSERLGNVNVHRIGFGNKFDKLMLPVLGCIKARQLIKNGLPVCLHAYQASYGAGSAWLVKLFNPGLHLKLTLQEGKHLSGQGFLINFFRNIIIRKSDSATVISRYLKNYILSVKKNLRVDVVPNGVDIQNFEKQFSYGETASLEGKLGVMPDDKVIITVSRLVHKNGIDLLIKALAILNKEDKYKLIIAGEGPLEESLKLQIKNLHLEDRVVFAGSVSHHDLPAYLKISDVFARPSRSEGLGSAFLEAMASGVPIVGTKIGGIPDFLEDRKTGLFSALDPEDIAFKIKIIAENENIAGHLTDNALKLVKEKYDWNIIAKQFRELYTDKIMTND